MNRRVLILGIGNPIRQDDGLGLYCIDLMKNSRSEGKSKLVDYMAVHQLDVIHSEIFARYSLLILIDADALNGPESVRIEEIEPEAKGHPFTSHIGSVSDILALTRRLHGTSPKTYLVAVRGASFEVGEGLSPTALHNAVEAVAAVESLIDKFLPFY